MKNMCGRVKTSWLKTSWKLLTPEEAELQWKTWKDLVNDPIFQENLSKKLHHDTDAHIIWRMKNKFI